MSDTDRPTPSSPPAEHIAQFFAFGHLPPHLKEVSRPFAELADAILLSVPRNPERTVALRKLLEAKDAAVRCAYALGVYDKNRAAEAARATTPGSATAEIAEAFERGREAGRSEVHATNRAAQGIPTCIKCGSSECLRRALPCDFDGVRGGSI